MAHGYQCPECEEELTVDDYYGRGIPGRVGFVKGGDIYKCENPECPREGDHFYTQLPSDELHEGYPC